MPRVDRTTLCLDAHHKLGLRCCRKCGAPEGMRVVRLWRNTLLWSLDTDLHLEHPDVYRRGTKVIIEKDADGICRFCCTPKGPNSDVARHVARLAEEAKHAENE